MRAFLRFCTLMGSSHIAGLKKLAGALVPGPKSWLGRSAKPHSAEAVCQGGGRLQACRVRPSGPCLLKRAAPPGCAGAPGAGSPAKKRVFLRMMELSGVAPRPKCLGAKAFTLEAAYPSKGVTCATASAWVISASPLSKSSRRYFQLPMPSSCIYES